MKKEVAKRLDQLQTPVITFRYVDTWPICERFFLPSAKSDTLVY